MWKFWGLKKMIFLCFRGDHGADVSYSFLPVMESSVAIFEDIPKTVSCDRELDVK